MDTHTICSSNIPIQQHTCIPYIPHCTMHRSIPCTPFTHMYSIYTIHANHIPYTHTHTYIHTQGIALSSEPGYKVLRAAYPWVARRLLTDQSPELRETLLALLYKNGRFQFVRCESLLREAIKSPARGTRGAAASGRAGGCFMCLCVYVFYVCTCFMCGCFMCSVFYVFCAGVGRKVVVCYAACCTLFVFLLLFAVLTHHYHTLLPHTTMLCVWYISHTSQHPHPFHKHRHPPPLLCHCPG